MKDNCDITKLRKKKSSRINSRTKGNAFERKVCALLNHRFNTSDFCRSPGSGAFASTHSLPSYLKVYGDLITPENFMFCVECKKGYNKENLTSLFKKTSDFWKFVKQSNKDAKKAGRESMIIYQQDRGYILVITKVDIFPLLEDTVRMKDYSINILEEVLKVEDCYWLS